MIYNTIMGPFRPGPPKTVLGGFARWDLVEHAVFWPPPAGVNPSKVTVPRQPGGEPCNVALGHFIAYCWGAAGIAHDFGRHSCAP